MKLELTSSQAATWERLPGEKWFGRFQRYLLAGPGRSIEGTWKAEAKQGGNSKQKQVPSGHWHRIAKKFSWKSRAEAFDVAQCEIEREQIAQERRQESRARRKLLRMYRERIDHALQRRFPAP